MFPCSALITSIVMQARRKWNHCLGGGHLCILSLQKDSDDYRKLDGGQFPGKFGLFSLICSVIFHLQVSAQLSAGLTAKALLPR